MAFPDFNALRELHNSANDLLHSPEIQQVLGGEKQEKWVNEVSEASLKMLDVCGVSKDVLLLVKEQLLDLQFTLRRKMFSVPHINSKISAYNDYRSKLKKETLKCLKLLKAMKTISFVADKSSVSAINHKLVVVVEVIKEVRGIAISTVESLLSLISIPWFDQKPAKESLRLKFFKPRDERAYDFFDETAIYSANKRLEAVRIAIEDLEMELDCICRRLIQTRVSLLNILTN